MREYRGVVRLLLLDVDGVLTDGTLCVGHDGELYKPFNVRDGLAVALLRVHGVHTGVLSGKDSKSLDRRIEELGIEISRTGRLNKLAAISEIERETGVARRHMAYVGDDVVDLPLAGVVDTFYAPSDAHPLVLRRADVVLQSAGGQGAAREAAEHVLRAGGLTLEDSYAPLMDGWEQSDAVQ